MIRPIFATLIVALSGALFLLPHAAAEAQRQDRSARTRPVTAAQAGRDRNVYYRNCSEARAARAAPIRRGEPGYAPHLDRDGDGIACEPYRRRR